MPFVLGCVLWSLGSIFFMALGVYYLLKPRIKRNGEFNEKQ